MISTTIILEKCVYAKLRLTHMAAKKKCNTLKLKKTQNSHANTAEVVFPQVTLNKQSERHKGAWEV